MRLDGEYDDSDAREPERIKLTGTPEEFKRIGPQPTGKAVKGKPVYSAPGGAYRQRPDGQWEADAAANPTQRIPADKRLVREIARKVEIECDDELLIDWMRSGE